MAIQLSPGVNVSEIDLTTVVPAVATSDAAIGGVFRWGPVGQRVLIDSETNLVNKFGKPSNFNAETWLTSASFLSYANRLYVSRAAKTTGSTPGNTSFTFATTANSSVGNNVLTTSVNTALLSVGMYINQSANGTAIPQTGEAYYITSVNSSAIILNQKIFPNTTGAAGAVSSELYFGRLDTSYTAVAVDPANSAVKVANLVNQIVKNSADYTAKDGNFGEGILYVAKYPGAYGNSLRISVCDNATTYSSNIALANSTVNTAIEFVVGSSSANVKFLGSSNTTANTIANNISIGDAFVTGNSSIGVQYLTVASYTITGNTTANVSGIDANAGINISTNFITSNNSLNGSLIINNGDAIVYANAAGNTAIGGLTNSTTYYAIEANTSGFKVSTTPYGTAITLTNGATETGHSFTSNTRTLSVSFNSSYRLRENYVSNTVQRNWEFINSVQTVPGQSNYQLLNGNTAAKDELHIVVVDDGGSFTGTPGTILEVYKGLSRATDAKNIDGSGNYYKDVINQNSNYIWWAHDRSVALSNTAVNLASSSATAPANMTMSLGSDGLSESDATLSILGAAYDMFISAEDVDISLVLQGKPIGGQTAINGETVSNYQLANYIIDNICGTRKDCIALISPDKSKVLNNLGNEATSLKNWRNALSNSSYAVLDSGYKYMYDKYNDVYRWIPLNGDIAGLCVKTDNTNDAWWSPAGFNRGQIKNVVKLAYNPKQADRDILYSNNINPVVTFPGQGTVLYGDKTLTAKPSAFDHINVRRLFIVLEKAISTASKYSLFEFNDAFTRAQFKNLVNPYLRNIKGRRGITDFLVVCDETNNTAQVIDSNQFVGDIYIKPARSINYIQLNFVAVGTGVQFSEVVGKF